MKLYITIFILTLFFPFFKAESHQKNTKNFTCADENGPRFEFTIPDLKNSLIKEDFSFKDYDLEDRNSFVFRKGVLEKKSSYIDDSYYFYKVNSELMDNDLKNIYFEFFPPSTLMLKQNSSNFLSLACWRESD